MSSRLALQIQRLGGFNEQVLVLLHVASLREATRSATPAHVASLFGVLHLPPPTNERQHLRQLRDRRLVMQPGPGRWAVTPEGHEEIRRLIGNVSADELSCIDLTQDEPVFAGAAHHLIPWQMAPTQFQQRLAQFLDNHPFERNVFCMTRYPQNAGDPLAAAIDACRVACSEAGLDLLLASDQAVHDQLFDNVGAYMWAAQYGIIVLERRVKGHLNQNVLIETGGMLMTGRRCLLLKDCTVEEVPTNLVGHIHKPVDVEDPSTVAAAVQEWIAADLNLA